LNKKNNIKKVLGFINNNKKHLNKNSGAFSINYCQAKNIPAITIIEYQT
jgi:hypothetical protein